MNANRNTVWRVSFLLVLVGMLCSPPGLQAWEWSTPKFLRLDNTWPFRDKNKPQEGIPVRMVGTWTDTVLSQAGQKPQRGFGGRLMFYDKEGKKPILVDGQLVVYAFDEAGRELTDNKPTRRYVFPAEQIPIHMSKTDLGASYSFWLPWDEAGGPRAEISLICRFEPKGGPVVTSEQTKHLLPGPTPLLTTAGSKRPPNAPEGVLSKPPRQTLENMQSSRNAEHNARLISYETPATGDQQAFAAVGPDAAANMPEKRMSATTITLPQNFQMPDAATLNAAAASMGYTQPGAQIPQNQVAPNMAQWQQPAAAAGAYAGTILPRQMPTTATSHPYMGIQMAPQVPNISQAPLHPGAPPMATGPSGWSNLAGGQMPQQQIQQPVTQQPTPQQQMLQQQMLQQQMMQQSAQLQQAWPQLPAQPGMATVSYPAQGQLVR